MRSGLAVRAVSFKGAYWSYPPLRRSTYTCMDYGKTKTKPTELKHSHRRRRSGKPGGYQEGLINTVK